MLYLKQSTTATLKFGPFLDATDGVTPLSGLAAALDNATTGIRLSKAAGAFADRGSSTVPAYDALGYYDVALSTTDTGTLGLLKVAYSDPSTCLPVWQDCYVVPDNIYDSLYSSGTDKLQVDITQINSSATSVLKQAAALDSIIINTVSTAVTPTTTIFSTGLGSTYTTSGALIGRSIIFTGDITAALNAQSGVITAYTATNGVVTIDAPLTVAPANTDTFIIV